MKFILIAITLITIVSGKHEKIEDGLVSGIKYVGDSLNRYTTNIKLPDLGEGIFNMRKFNMPSIPEFLPNFGRHSEENVEISKDVPLPKKIINFLRLPNFLGDEKRFNNPSSTESIEHESSFPNKEIHGRRFAQSLFDNDLYDNLFDYKSYLNLDKGFGKVISNSILKPFSNIVNPFLNSFNKKNVQGQYKLDISSTKKPESVVSTIQPSEVNNNDNLSDSPSNVDDDSPSNGQIDLSGEKLDETESPSEDTDSLGGRRTIGAPFSEIKDNALFYNDNNKVYPLTRSFGGRTYNPSKNLEERIDQNRNTPSWMKLKNIHTVLPEERKYRYLYGMSDKRVIPSIKSFNGKDSSIIFDSNHNQAISEKKPREQINFEIPREAYTNIVSSYKSGNGVGGRRFNVESSHVDNPEIINSEAHSTQPINENTYDTDKDQNNIQSNVYSEPENLNESEEKPTEWDRHNTEYPEQVTDDEKVASLIKPSENNENHFHLNNCNDVPMTKLANVDNEQMIVKKKPVLISNEVVGKEENMHRFDIPSSRVFVTIKRKIKTPIVVTLPASPENMYENAQSYENKGNVYHLVKKIDINNYNPHLAARPLEGGEIIELPLHDTLKIKSIGDNSFYVNGQIYPSGGKLYKNIIKTQYFPSYEPAIRGYSQQFRINTHRYVPNIILDGKEITHDSNASPYLANAQTYNANKR